MLRWSSHWYVVSQLRSIYLRLAVSVHMLLCLHPSDHDGGRSTSAVHCGPSIADPRCKLTNRFRLTTTESNTSTSN